jgi:hypothetical protein
MGMKEQSTENSWQSSEPLTFEKVWTGLMENRLQMQETDRRMKETDRQIGRLGNRFGELIEHLVTPNIMEKFNEIGFHFDSTTGRREIKDKNNPNMYAEIDIMLENGDIAIAVEVKAKPDRRDVEDHVKRMGVLRWYADRHGDARKYLGAIAGGIISQDIRDYILENGFYLIEQTGDTVKLTIPEGFTPREW